MLLCALHKQRRAVAVMKMKSLTLLGQVVLTVVVGVTAGAVGSRLQNTRPLDEKKIEWEHLEGVEGSDLQRIKLPNGWLVENADGFLAVVVDFEHKWLEEDSE